MISDRELNIRLSESGVVRIDRDHELFWTLHNNHAMIPRAAVELSADCPNPDYVLHLISKGFVKAVAYVTKEEHMMMKLAR